MTRVLSFLPILLGLIVPAMASGRATLQGTAAVCLIITVALVVSDKSVRDTFSSIIFTRTGLLISLAFAGMLGSVFVSLEPQRSFEAWGRTIVFLLGSLLFFIYLRQSPDHTNLCLKSFVIGILVTGTIIIVALLGYTWPLQFIKMEFSSYVTQLTEDPLQPYFLKWPAIAVKAYAAALACALPALIFVAWHSDGRWRWAAAIAAAICPVVIIFSNNKSAIAGLLAMLIILSVLLAWRRGGRGMIVWTLFAIASSAAALYLVYILPEPPPSPAVWDWLPTWLIDAHRQQIWNFAAQKFTEAPLFGHGINVIDRVTGAEMIPEGYRVQVLPSHPHNWVLEILAETGLIGLIPVIAALTWFFGSRVRDYIKTGNAASLTQVAIGSVFWASALFNFSIWSSWWLITFFVLTTIIGASNVNHPKSNQHLL